MDKGVPGAQRVLRTLLSSLEPYESDLNLAMWAVGLAVVLALSGVR
jgi:hypothetical protein